MANRLAGASSPYLRQHADNPIDWWPWGPQALDEARRRELPLLVSIGYSACHWCHVMAAESFSDPAVARFVNEHFVPVKVDREENPDVDQVFMTATQALTGQGGWPMTVFCTPDAEPFFAGTYFPPAPSERMPSFEQVCRAMAEAWDTRREEILRTGGKIAGALSTPATGPAPRQNPDPARLLERLLSMVDEENGGFGSAPKFPQAPALDALMVTGDPTQIAAVQLSLDHIVRGGIHDIVGGGFHRYAVDAAWNVPHFEKMLYDNALMLGTLTRAWRRTGPEAGDLRDHLEMALRGIVRWLDTRMRIRGEHGWGYAASTDADSPDGLGGLDEGGYYLWTPSQMNQLFDRRDSLFAQACFHLTTRGTMPDGRSTLRLHGDPDMPRLLRILDRIRRARAERPEPTRDDKIVASWNGLLIDSLVQAAMVFGEPGWLEDARQVVEHLWMVHGFRHEHAVRISLGDRPGNAPAMLDDWAGFALGAARLAAASGDPAMLDRAVHALEVACALFGTTDGGFYDAPGEASLFTRAVSLSDEATPSATSIVVRALQLVGSLTGQARWSERARRAEPGLWAALEQSPLASGWGLAELAVSRAADAGLGRAQVALVDPRADPAGLLVRAAWRLAPEGSAVVLGRPGATGFGSLFDDRPAIDGAPTAYICRGQTCFEPVTDFMRLREPMWRPVVHATLSPRPARSAVRAAVAAGRPVFEWRGLPRGEYASPGPQRDAVVAAILAGEKTASAALLAEYGHAREDPTAQLGRYEVVIDSAAEPVCLTRVDSARVVRLAEVDLSHARAEGYASLEAWRAAHERYWTSPQLRAELGDPQFVPGGDTPVVLVRFRVYRPGDVVEHKVVDFGG